jgi:hypothetical protein
MPTQVRLFISAGPELEPAREILGRALAGLPVNVGWVIKRTPDVDSVAECHLFLIMFGSDIWAPVGLELYWARRTEKPILAYRSAKARTPAGTVFVQENSDLEWSSFADLAALRRTFVRDVGRFLMHHGERYGVTLTEMQSLTGYIQGLDQTPKAPVPAKATGAAGGGVILAPGKDEPPGAHVIGEE